MILPHRTMLYLFLWLITISSHCRGNEFQPCYDSNNLPQRCEPLSATFSLYQVPTVNSTCGTPPTTFCRRSYSIISESITDVDCSYTCDAGDSVNSHGPEKITDFSDGETWWQSESGIHSPQTVSIQIDLEIPVQVESILMNFISFKPDGLYILRSQDYGNNFEPFNYFAFDCLSKYMIDPNVQLIESTETQALCQQITNPAPGQVTFVPTLNRPSGNDSLPGFSQSLHEFSTVTNIRVILDGHYLFTEQVNVMLNESDYYYAIEDLSIVGKCQCNGHADVCTNENSNGWACECQHNTAGSMCERCLDLYNDLQWDVAIGDGAFECKKCNCNGHADACIFNQTLFEMSGNISGGMCVNCTDNTGGPKCDQCVEYYYSAVSSPIDCQECNCYADGIMDDGICQRLQNASTPVGQCNCKINVEGRTCDRCKEGYFNLVSSNIEGCEECGCDGDLSISSTCDNVTGVCECRPNVIGDKCDTCEPGYYLSDPSTCSKCGCDLGGSLSTVCDVSTGQCDCRSGVTGRTCREVEEDMFFPFIDYYIYEAEESQGGLFEASYRLPNDPLNTQFTGSGYVLITDDNDLINFGQFTPPVSGVYEFVLRYRLVEIMLWDTIELRLMFDETVVEEQSPPSCSEHSDPSTKYFYENLPISQIGAATLSVCLRGGRTYSVVVNGFDSGTPMTELEIDSMVILIKEPEGITSLSDPGIRAKYNQCIVKFRSLMTRDNAKNNCEDVSFSVLTEIFNQTLDCDCDPIGAKNETCYEYGGQCDCKTLYNIDRQCGTCAMGSYIEPDDNDGCAECTCSNIGSVDPFCNRFGGACTCLNNVDVADSCDHCVDDTYNLQPIVGCEQCNCHLEGSNNTQCYDNGTCSCKDGVIGEKCDTCDPENFNFPICSVCNCDPAGSTSLSCTIDGQCFCRKNTMVEKKCNVCSNGTFNLQLSNDDGCQPCYCSGISSSCSSAPDFVAFQEETLFENGYNWTVSSGADIINLPFVDGVTVDANSTAYVIAPDNYLGNKLSSYRQYLSVSVDIMNDIGGFSEGYDVLIASYDNRLVTNFTQELVLGDQILSVRFIENAGWIDLSTDLPVSTAQLQSTLIALVRLEIRISLSNDVVLSSITLDTAVEDSNNMSSFGWVEECICGQNYTGLSCEQCEDGYTRNDTGHCVVCECNDYADLCDKEDGVCIDCLDNTTDDHCDVCIDGYYGDPRNNISCLQCECPFSGNNGQYSSTCELSGDDGINCTNCSVGHSGDQCDTCVAGYFGDPLGVNGDSTRCTTCNCSNNIDASDSDSCNKMNGVCTKCLYNTTGDECQDCLYGYYGDPIYAKNCTDCGCNLNGTSNDLQCNSTGECNCLPNVTGTKCTECIPLHYNFGLDTGCVPCDCDPVGRLKEQCDIVTGQCECKSNVGYERCDKCLPGYYNFSSEGCKDCDCNIGSSDGTCDDNGICSCTSGAIGDKCDMCAENFFISTDGTQCNVCPSCYTEVQGTVNQTRDYYSILRSLVNALAGQNDPTTTFEEKRAFALDQVFGLESDIDALVSQYGQLYIDVNQLLLLTNKLNISTITLVELIAIAEIKVSPYAKLVESAKLTVNALKNEIYAGQDVLISIETVIYPEILSNTDYLKDKAMRSNVTLDELVMYVEMLENQTNNIITLVEQATDAATSSLSTATSLVTLSNDNNNSLSIVQATLNELDSDLSLAVQELAAFNMSIIYAQMSIGNIEAKLPTLPSKSYIMSQISKIDQLQHTTNTILDSYNRQWTLFRSLNNSLANIQTDYNNIQLLLSQTADTINQYLDDFTSIFDKATTASTKASTDLLEAESILVDLMNFSNATAALKAKADQALLMAADINETINMVEEVVSESISQLDDVSVQLDELLSASLSLQSDSKTVNEDSNKLLDDSASLSEQTTDLLNTFTANQASINQLYSSVVSSIEDIDDTNINAQAVFDILYSDDIQDLPLQAGALSNNAIEIVSNLVTELSSCPSVDEEFLNWIEEFVMLVGDTIDSTNISSAYDQLWALYSQQEAELNNLNEQIDDIDNRVSRLKAIMSSLPSDCDSNV